MSFSPWETMVAGVDGGKVAEWRKKLVADRDYDASDEAFVAIVQQALHELEGGESVRIVNEALEWGDSTFSFVAGEGDQDQRRKAIAWAVAASLPRTSKHEASMALRILDKYYGAFDEPDPHEAFRALVSVAERAPQMPAEAWKWLAERAKAYVHEGVASAEQVRAALEKAHQGPTKGVVSGALVALGGELPASVKASSQTEGAKKKATKKGTKKTAGKRSLADLADAVGAASPSAVGERVALGQETVLGAESLAWLPTRGATALLKTTKLGEVPKRIVELANWFQGAPSWASRASVTRSADEWVVVRLDRIVEPQDVARWGDAFDPEMLLGERAFPKFDRNEGVALALLRVAEGIAAVTWSGPSCPLPIDESTATESSTSVCRWHW